MCAISGILKYHRRDSIDPEVLTRMTDIMSHRGPDARGEYIDGNLGLGHRRLSIIDLAGGDQPISNEDGSVVVVFNGEIYNYAGLAATLSDRGHQFRTRSDTETIVHAYEEYGERCVDHFRGMFAFALWDRNRQKLLLARDRLGIKPLYYYEGSDFIAFASEIKALLEIPGVPREVEPDALSHYLSLRYVPGPQTMFRNIVRLQPGHLLTRADETTSVRKYWDIEFRPADQSPQQRLQQFDQLLTESVRLRLAAEVPLGVFLSGGLDSSAILAMMSRMHRSHGIHTFSVGYEDITGKESRSNEFEYAQIAAKAYGAEHHEYRLTPDELQDFMPALAWHLDEPLGDPTCVPLYFISKTASERITVVLSGEGADELLAGYGIYQRMLQIEKLHRNFGGLASAMEPVLRHVMPGERFRTALKWAALPLHRRYRGVSRGFLPDMKRALLPGSDQSEHKLDALFEGCFQAAKPASPLDQMLYADTRIWLPDDLLLKADKMTMANAIELRVPFLDHRMVEYAATLPAVSKLQKGIGKVLLRQDMSGDLPPAILHRPKKGFPVPIGPWLKTELRSMVHDSLLSRGSAVRDYMNMETIEKVVRQHETGRFDRSQEIWTLLVFEFWHRVFMNRSIGDSGRLFGNVTPQEAL
jgi:asparagine synthase (glutamine-hydrolysing)